MSPAVRLALLLGAAGGWATFSSAQDAIASGDTIFLWSNGNNSVDVEGDTARARWQVRGNWQALVIERLRGGGGILAGDAVTIMANNRNCLSVDQNQEVRATPGDCAAWLIFGGENGAAIRSGDAIFLKLSGEDRYLDIEGDASSIVRARYNDKGPFQALRIEREPTGAVLAGDFVTLAAHTGAKLDVQGEGVRARWTEVGFFRALFQESDENVGPWMHAFRVYGGHGRVLYSGDQVNLWAFSGKLLGVNGQALQAHGDKIGDAQTFVIEKDGGGAILREDAVFLRAQTGRYVEVQKTAAEVVGQARGPAGRFAIRIYEGSQGPQGEYRQLAVILVLCLATCAILGYECYWSAAKSGEGRPEQQPQQQHVATATATGAPRLEALEAPRWIASAQIVGCHFYGFEWGCAWTQFFFVLSGFVLAYVELAKPVGKGAQMSQFRYVAHRLVTLYPTYLFVLALSAVQWQTHSALDWLCLPLHVLMMHAWFPITYKREGSDSWQWTGLQWVAVSWFVSVLVLYWLLLRPLANRARRMSLRACIAALLMLWAWSGVYCFVGDWLLRVHYGCDLASERCFVVVGQAMIYHGPFGMLHIFVAGIVMARVFILTSTCDAATGQAPGPASQRLALDWARAPLAFRYGACLGYLGFGLLAWLVNTKNYENNRYLVHNGGVLPLMLLVLVGGALGGDPLVRYIFQNRVFRLLGRISYAQYLLQFNVYYFMTNIFPSQHALVPLRAIFPVGLFVTAYLLERLVTRVGTEWLRPGKGKQRGGSVERVITLLESGFRAHSAPEQAKARAEEGGGGGGARPAPALAGDEEAPLATPPADPPALAEPPLALGSAQAAGSLVAEERGQAAQEAAAAAADPEVPPCAATIHRSIV